MCWIRSVRTELIKFTRFLQRAAPSWLTWSHQDLRLERPDPQEGEVIAGVKVTHHAPGLNSSMVSARVMLELQYTYASKCGLSQTAICTLQNASTSLKNRVIFIFLKNFPCIYINCITYHVDITNCMDNWKIKPI
jgi:hypothetical protein